MSILENIWPRAMLRVLGYMALHSLRRKTPLGLLAALLRAVLHRQTAAVRYWVAGGALGGLLLAGPTGT